MKVLEINLNGFLEGHDDIELKMNGNFFEKKADSYWFHEIPGHENFTVPEIFALNIKALRDHLAIMEFEDTAYLPLELNDQSAGFLCLKKISKRGIINIFYVQSITKIGSEISPLFSPDFALDFKDYFSIEFACVCSQEDLIEDLDRIINEQI